MRRPDDWAVRGGPPRRFDWAFFLFWLGYACVVAWLVWYFVG